MPVIVQVPAVSPYRQDPSAADRLAQSTASLQWAVAYYAKARQRNHTQVFQALITRVSKARGAVVAALDASDISDKTLHHQLVASTEAINLAGASRALDILDLAAKASERAKAAAVAAATKEVADWALGSLSGSASQAFFLPQERRP